MVQRAKSPVKNLVRQRCTDGFNSGLKGLSNVFIKFLKFVHVSPGLNQLHNPSLLGAAGDNIPQAFVASASSNWWTYK
jgi:hypothetical protein